MLLAAVDKQLTDLFTGYTAREQRSDVLEVSSWVAANAYTTSGVVVTSLPVVDETYYPYCVLELGGARRARVVAAVDYDNLTLSWRAPVLNTALTSVTSVTLMSTPLAGATYWVSGKGAGDVVIAVDTGAVSEDGASLGRGYGSLEESVAGVCSIYVRTNKTETGDYDDALTKLYYLFDQVREVLRGGMLESCRRVFLPHARISKFRQEQHWYFRSEMTFRYTQGV